MMFLPESGITLFLFPGLLERTRMKKWIRKNYRDLILLFVFLFGMSLILYPSVANWWNRRVASVTTDAYEGTVNRVDPKIIQGLLDDAEKYNEELPANSSRLYPSQEEHDQYVSQLNLNDIDIMGTVEIPCVDISFPIYHGTSADVLNVAVGHLEGTSLPIGGKTSHCVLSGHRGLPSLKVFDRIPELENGDLIFLKVFDETYTYQVDGQEVVEPTNMECLDMEEGKDLLTLITCTPYGINTHRLLVKAHRIANLPEEEEQQEFKQSIWQNHAVIIAIVAGLVLILIIILLIWKKRKKSRVQKSKHKNTKRNINSTQSSTRSNAKDKDLNPDKDFNSDKDLNLSEDLNSTSNLNPSGDYHSTDKGLTNDPSADSSSNMSISQVNDETTDPDCESSGTAENAVSDKNDSQSSDPETSSQNKNNRKASRKNESH